MIVYMATNTKNGKRYIGQSVQKFEKRKRVHLWNARNGVKNPFYNAIRKYGTDSFEWVILCNADSFEELQSLEIYFIAAYGTLAYKGKGYNIKLGGGNSRTPLSTRKKISAGNKGKKQTAEARAKISIGMKGEKNHFFGKKHTAKARVNISKGKKGKKLTSEHRAKLSEAGKGKKQTAEARAKISIGQTGEKNHNHDRRIHALHHKDYGLAYTTQVALREEFSLNQSHLSAVVIGKEKSHKGWSLASQEYIQTLRETTSERICNQ